MNPHRIPKTRSVSADKKWLEIGIFKPGEPHSPWVACSAGLLKAFAITAVNK